MRERFGGLSGLRGLAAAAVLLFHLGLIRWGWIGVDLFFVLSGFLLTLAFLGPTGPPAVGRNWAAFVWRRYLRIAPPFYASIVLWLGVTGTWSYATTDTGDLLLHLTYMFSFSSSSFFGLDPVYWTLANEFQFYLLLPVFAVLMTRRSWPWVLGGSLALTLAWRFASHGPIDTPLPEWQSLTLPAFLFHFVLGVAAANAFRSGWRIPGSPTLAAAGFLLALVVIPFLVGIPAGSVRQADETFLANLIVRPMAALGFAGVILCVARSDGRLGQTLSWAPLRGLGLISYSRYLIHIPVLLALAQWPAYAALTLPLKLAAGSAACVLAATAFFLAIERPALRLRDRRRADRSGRPSAADQFPAAHPPLLGPPARPDPEPR